MLPAIYEPLHVVNFENEVIEFIKSKDREELIKKLNTERTVSFGETTYASRLFIKCEPFTNKDGLECFIATLDRETRKKLTASIAEYKEKTGKQMPLHTAQCTVEAWNKEITK